jgi:hypothetical protein
MKFTKRLRSNPTKKETWTPGEKKKKQKEAFWKTRTNVGGDSVGVR